MRLGTSSPIVARPEVADGGIGCGAIGPPCPTARATPRQNTSNMCVLTNQSGRPGGGVEAAVMARSLYGSVALPWEVMERGRGALAGILAAALGLGVGELVAGLARSAAAPVVPVGQVVIDHVPISVKEWAIRNFGSSDKAVPSACTCC